MQENIAILNNKPFEQAEEEKRMEKNELTEEEKKEIDLALETENVFELRPSLNDKRLSDEVLQKIIAAQQKILFFGPRGLEYLKEKIIDSDSYVFSLFASTMAEESNFNTIVDSLTRDSVAKISDGSAAGRLSQIIQQLIYDIRQKNPNDPRLIDAANKMIEVIETIDLRFKKSDYLTNLAFTGTKIAKDYFDNKPGLKDAYGWCLSDAKKDPRKLFRLDRYKFETWDEVLSIRHEREYNHSNFVSREYGTADDYYRPFFGDFGYDDYFSEHTEYQNATLSERDKELVNETEIIFDRLDLPNLNASVVSVAKLWIFNQLRINQDKSKISEVADKINNMAEVERECENNPLLPTIGIEIECEKDMLTPEKVAALNALMIPNYEEGHLWEVNPNFSYSALVQSRYLQELVKMGAVLTEKKEDGKAFIPSDHLLSLHINLGVPAQMEYKGEDKYRYKKSIYLFNDALNYAFTSSQRMQGRKTAISVDFPDAIESKKSKYQKEQSAGKNQRKEKKRKYDNSYEFVRMELRAFEFRDYKTYLMLESAQRLGAGLFSHIRSTNKEKLDEQEKKLARLWKLFEKDFLEIIRKKKIRVVNLVDKDSYAAADLVEEGSFRNECRELVYKYTRKAGEALDIRKRLPVFTEAQAKA